MANHTLARLAADRPVRGAWVTSNAPRVAEALARSPLDWVGVDGQHAPASAERTEDLVRAIEPHATPVVRLPSVDRAVDGAAAATLDAGARGLIVPNVATGAEAEAVVDAAHYPPEGTRGVAGTVRANGYGADFAANVRDANADLLLVVQVESETGVENVADVLGVAGVDAVLVGRNDLAASMGYPGDADRPEVREAVDRVRRAALDAGVAPGVKAGDADAVAARVDDGYRFLLLGSDFSLLRRGLDPLV
ncbi:MAG: HpcH/HpaI aldolase/citrate lyase family protein [Haloplanus sp.]